MFTEESKAEHFLVGTYKTSHNTSLMNSQSVMSTPKHHINGRPSPSLRNWSNHNKKLVNPISRAYVNVLNDKIEFENSSNAKIKTLNNFYHKNRNSNNNRDYVQMQEVIEHKSKMDNIESRQRLKNKVKKRLNENRKMERVLLNNKGGLNLDIECHINNSPNSKTKTFLRKQEPKINYDDCINAKQRCDKLMMIRRQEDLRKLDNDATKLGIDQKDLQKRHKEFLNFKRETLQKNPNDELVSNFLKIDQKELNYMKVMHEKYDNKLNDLM